MTLSNGKDENPFVSPRRGQKATLSWGKKFGRDGTWKRISEKQSLAPKSAKSPSLRQNIDSEVLTAAPDGKTGVPQTRDSREDRRRVNGKDPSE